MAYMSVRRVHNAYRAVFEGRSSIVSKSVAYALLMRAHDSEFLSNEDAQLVELIEMSTGGSKSDGTYTRSDPTKSDRTML